MTLFLYSLSTRNLEKDIFLYEGNLHCLQYSIMRLFKFINYLRLGASGRKPCAQNPWFFACGIMSFGHVGCSEELMRFQLYTQFVFKLAWNFIYVIQDLRIYRISTGLGLGFASRRGPAL